MLRNCFIGHMMQQNTGTCLPIVACAIFCCIARRLGLDAHCCSVPTHVHVVVIADEGRDLNDQALQSDGPQIDMMYMDPTDLDVERTIADIEERITPLQIEPYFLRPASASSVALRMAGNIKASFRKAMSMPQEAWPTMVQLARGHPVVNLFAANYSAMWAFLMLLPAYTPDWDLELSLIMKRFEEAWPEDAWLVEKYLIPRWQTFAPFRGPWAQQAVPETAEFWRPLRLLRARDETITVKRRNAHGTEVIPYRIGQVFRHTRHRRIGVIRGWLPPGSTLSDSDDTDHSDDNVGPQNLRTKVYFVCLMQYALDPNIIRADNIGIIHDPSLIREGMFPWAGKYFKRFDHETCTYISNMKEEYPDD
jgi:F-box protein 21